MLRPNRKLDPETGKWSTEETKLVDVRIIDKGIMRRLWWGSEEIEAEMKKNNKPYHIWSADGSALLINYDDDKLRPFVKDYFARQGTLLELEWIKKTFFITVSVQVVISMLLAFNVWQTNQLAKKVLNDNQATNSAISSMIGAKVSAPQNAEVQKTAPEEPKQSNSFFAK